MCGSLTGEGARVGNARCPTGCARSDAAAVASDCSTGLSLMMMKPRLERSEQAIAAFQRTKASPTLPDGERENVNKAIAHAQYRLQEGKDSLDMPDMSNCVIA